MLTFRSALAWLPARPRTSTQGPQRSWRVAGAGEDHRAPRSCSRVRSSRDTFQAMVASGKPPLVAVPVVLHGFLNRRPAPSVDLARVVVVAELVAGVDHDGAPGQRAGRGPGAVGGSVHRPADRWRAPAGVRPAVRSTSPGFRLRDQTVSPTTPAISRTRASRVAVVRLLIRTPGSPGASRPRRAPRRSPRRARAGCASPAAARTCRRWRRPPPHHPDAAAPR